MNDVRSSAQKSNRRNTRANSSLVDSNIRDLGLSSVPRGKVLRTPPLRHPSYPVHTPSLRELNPSPRIEISWGSDEVPDDTILERTVQPSESAPAVENPVEHVQPPECESVTAERLDTTAEDILVASLDSSAVVDSDITAAVSAAETVS